MAVPSGAVSTDVSIQATPEAVWTILADLAGVAVWSPTVGEAHLLTPRARGLGARRHVAFVGGTHLDRAIDDEVVEWNEGASFTVASAGLRAVRGMRSSWSVRSAPGGSIATLTFAYHPPFGVVGRVLIGRFLRRWMEDYARHILGGLRAYAETGRPLPKLGKEAS